MTRKHTLDLNMLKREDDIMKTVTVKTAKSENEYMNLNKPVIEFLRNFIDIIDATYVVKDQQTFLDWANNLEGNDYTNVIILPGEYMKVGRGIDLSLTKTYTIQGIQIKNNVPIIRFLGSASGFYYSKDNEEPSEFDLFEINGYCFKNIHVIMDNDDSEYFDITGLKNMSNIENVTVEIVASKVPTDVVRRYYPFSYCRNIFDSCGKIFDDPNDNDGIPSEYIIFDHCNNIRHTYTILEGMNIKGHIIRYNHSRNYDDSNVLYS